ncbi:uncharacterized protein LOC125772123 isoform X2 [Anopheles funestus]|uniref:uncharacterized protein LOC125772123 isoform X2 n=1 Tax=Anopheles funestus TaxID=62324 RepID=UPI0020C73880|nr:uncharacterized protein LOC125772123 isoform X2 [Anopheles funestus]XP_049299521.1 uncharacterized protein LOC125772123 isoform X2 [Anopheles funestus]
MQRQEMFMTVKGEQRPVNSEQLIVFLMEDIKEFHHDSAACVTFSDWYVRYESLFHDEGSKLDDNAKVRLLLIKLGMAEYEMYCSYILPKTTKDFNFDSTVKTMKLLFDPQESKFSKRVKCLRLEKMPYEDYVTFACRVNKSFVEAEFAQMSEEAFRCLIFVCGLKDNQDADIRMRLISMIEEQTDVTLEQLMVECQKQINLRQYAALFKGEQTKGHLTKKECKVPWPKIQKQPHVARQSYGRNR